MSKDTSKKYISVFCVFFEVPSSRVSPTQEELKLAWDEHRTRKFEEVDVEFVSTSYQNADV
jgi:hypothetical protein